MSDGGVRWTRINRRLLAVFGPILIIAGVAGFVVPPNLALLSGATPYNVFHITFGVLGTALVLAGHPLAIASFNLGFGLIDLYQAVAGVGGFFPSTVFHYRPLDHVVHVVLGLLLVVVGGQGLRGRS